MLTKEELLAHIQKELSRLDQHAPWWAEELTNYLWNDCQVRSWADVLLAEDICELALELFKE